MSDESNLVQVYSALDGTDAHLLMGFLEDEGIEVFLDHEETAEMFAFPNDPSGAPTISVREEQAELAREIVARYEARNRESDDWDEEEGEENA